MRGLASIKESRALRYALWALVVFSPIISYLIIGLASDTSLLSLDAWNTGWNDEQRHYRTVQQMRAIGEPSGVAGYDEVPAPRPSYGPYCVLTYLPYYLGSFISGYESHNFMYVLNASFGVLSCLVIVLVLRPDVRESILIAVLFAFQFIVSRYLCSGMTEGSYVLYGAVFACCAVILIRNADPERRRRRWPIVVSFVVMIVFTGIWGGMRPYILAFLLVPWFLLAVCDFGLGKLSRILLALAGVLAAAGALGFYMYASKYYATPYLSSSSFADSFLDMIAKALPGLVGQNVAAVRYSVVKFVQFQWRGILVFGFAAGWVALLALFVQAVRRGERVMAAFTLALVLAGLAIFEANLLLYSYKQLYRMVIVVDTIYLVSLVFCASKLKIGGKVPVRALCIGAFCLACSISLVIKPSSFAYPQVSKDHDPAVEIATNERLQQIMPRSDDPWANTLAHPIEGGGIQLYFSLPPYMNTNNLRMSYLKKAIKDNSLKSKYVSIPERNDINKTMRKRYTVIYEGGGHVIYQIW